MEKITSLALGGVGFASSALESGVLQPEFDYSRLISALSQIAIALVTVISLLRTRRNNINS